MRSQASRRSSMSAGSLASHASPSSPTSAGRPVRRRTRSSGISTRATRSAWAESTPCRATARWPGEGYVVRPARVTRPS
ncbi:hypothetical protein ACFPRL_12265 [Pseudoclavibacter helvolus]